jgi:hypothetical protein
MTASSIFRVGGRATMDPPAKTAENDHARQSVAIFVATRNTSTSLDALSGLLEWRLRRGG